ncbi:GltK1 [Desulforapulum autotrophicum HRM2]|uniref:Glutamate/aspartate import permease protein GltK n=1 Tax=Desulforapulum autotrophicum (strain ATCC 43914 / DSM 3382 / VKM B-1955 / HRM2) TaxID=177437 RepID=C0QJV3_DESAH|nr:amino acid ABC transporter permease [Desulforapulum autotrophicum]ACN13956.1 GltK1 [Desulforapulum autotrophicum HRM2]
MNFEWQVITHNFTFLMGGLLTTCELAVIAITGGLFLGILLGMARLSTIKAIYYPATLFINLMRTQPLILVIFWLYFLMPLILGKPIGDFTSASIAFILFEASYFAEIIRAGIQSIPKGQAEAAYSSGFTYWQTMRYFIIPQALKNMLPSLITQGVVVFQDTSLAYVIGLREFLRSANVVDAREMRSFELYLFVGLVYLLVCFSISRIGKRMELKRGIA